MSLNNVGPQREFVVLLKDGTVRAGPLYAEEANLIMRLIPEADRWAHQTTGIVHGTKLRGPLRDMRLPRGPSMMGPSLFWGSG